MYEHYLEKHKENVDDITSLELYTNRLFINDTLNNKTKYELIKFERCTFSKIGFREVEFSNTQFNHSVFIGCYFQKTKFDNILFSNCIFINCGFYNCKFNGCDFFYTEWEKTAINYKDIIQSLPNRQNLRKKLCRRMAKEWLAMGDISEFKNFFFEAKLSQEAQYKEIIIRKEEYYKETYEIKDSFKYLFKYILSKFERYVWGYGERISNVILTSFVTISLFSAIYYHSQIPNTEPSNKLLTSIYISISYFLTISCGIEYENLFYRIVTCVEGFFGIAFMGFFVASLFRRINSR